MIEVLCADTLTIAPADLPPYHVVITDPPYGEHVHANTTSIGTGGAGTRKRDLGFEAASADLRLHVARLCHSAARWSAVFSDVESTHLWRDRLTAAGLQYVRTVPWIRWSQPQLSGDRPPTGCEMITLAHPRTKKRWNGSGGLTHFACRPIRNRDKHPTEKPLDLMLALVSAFSDPGELVLDPFAGWGTTLLAAALLGRDAIGIERDPLHAAIAEQRIAAFELAGFCDRDANRARLWADETISDAESVPAPKRKCQEKTYERAQRRIADAKRVLKALP